MDVRKDKEGAAVDGVLTRVSEHRVNWIESHARPEPDRWGHLLERVDFQLVGVHIALCRQQVYEGDGWGGLMFRFATAECALTDFSLVRVPQSILDQTVEALRAFGSSHREGLVLWAGTASRGCAWVRTALVPDQRTFASHGGCGYVVDAEALFALNNYLSKNHLLLIAQIHSHPREAFHSDTDDELAIVTKEGGFSIVVPDFGACSANLEYWAIYQLRDGRWVQLDPAEIESAFLVEEES